MSPAPEHPVHHPTREQHAEETRATILREAKRLFMEFGYRAVSTRMVAEAARLTQPALYHHFASKEDLYVAVLTQELTEMGTRLRAIAEGDGTARERLERAAAYLLSRTHQNISIMQHDIRTELSDEAASTVGARFFANVVEPINRIVGDGIAQGLVAPPAEIGFAPMQMGLYFLHQVSFLTRPPARTEHGHAIARHLREQNREAMVVSLFLRGVGAGQGDG